MAVKSCTVSNSPGNQDRTALLATWAAAGSTDTFAPLSMLPEYTCKSVHVSGTFDSATVVLKGSNTGVNYVGLSDPQGVAISITSEGLKQVQENVNNYQPVATGGSGSQAVVVTMLFVKASAPR